jgi:glycosylphosphatidylinositol transamidase
VLLYLKTSAGWQGLTLILALSTIPALLYTLIERGILRMNTTVLGARYELRTQQKHCILTRVSIWVFTLLAMEAMKTYKANPYFMLGDTKIPTWITPLVLVLFTSVLVPSTSFLGHICGLLFGYGCKLPQRIMDNGLTITGGLGYLKFLAPPEKILRWIEGKMNLLGRLPHYVSVDQKTYGRFGVLPTTTTTPTLTVVDPTYVASTNRLGP